MFNWFLFGCSRVTLQRLVVMQGSQLILLPLLQYMIIWSISQWTKWETSLLVEAPPQAFPKAMGVWVLEFMLKYLASCFTIPLPSFNLPIEENAFRVYTAIIQLLFGAFALSWCNFPLCEINWSCCNSCIWKNFINEGPTFGMWNVSFMISFFCMCLESNRFINIPATQTFASLSSKIQQ